MQAVSIRSVKALAAAGIGLLGVLYRVRWISRQRLIARSLVADRQPVNDQ